MKCFYIYLYHSTLVFGIDKFVKKTSHKLLYINIVISGASAAKEHESYAAHQMSSQPKFSIFAITFHIRKIKSYVKPYEDCV